MKNLTKKQLLIINKIENLLNLKMVDKCSFLKNKIISFKFDYKNLEHLKEFNNQLNEVLVKYKIGKCQLNGGQGLAIIISN